MSDVSMCALQEDGNRTPKAKQKRPLSIIEEYDSDDSSVPEIFRNGDNKNGSSKENTPLTEDSNDIPKSSKDDKINAKSPKVLESTRRVNSPKTVKNVSTSKTAPGSPKTRPEMMLKSSKGRPSSPISRGRPASPKSRGSPTPSSPGALKTRPEMMLKSSKGRPASPKSKGSPTPSSPGSPKTRREMMLKSSKGRPASPMSRDSPTPTSPSGDSKFPVFKTKGGRRSALAPAKNENKTENVENSHSSGSEIDKTNQVSENSRSKSAKHPSSADNGTQEASRQNVDSSNDNNQTNVVGQQRPAADGQGLARIRETAERLQLTTPLLSPTSPSSFSSLSSSPKFGHRLKGQNSASRSYLEGKAQQVTSVPQITITSTGVIPPRFILHEDIPEDAVDSSTGHFQNDNGSVSPSLKHRAKYHHPKSPKLSSFFSRRLSTESTGSLSDTELSDGSSSVMESPEDTPTSHVSDFWRLKETTEKLRLSTRRPSTMLWRQQYMESPGFPRIRPNLNGDTSDERLTSDRKRRIDDALEWLRKELQEMRSQDQNLARQLLAIRQDLHQLKLRRSTEEHQELIDDFQSELEELQEFSDVLDLPQPVYGDNPLKQLGITRLNLSARRFSAC